MIYRVDELVRKAQGRKYGISAFHVFHMDIMDACFRAASISHAALVLCCDFRKMDPEEVIHWMLHYAKQYPQVEFAPVALNIQNHQEAMQAFLLGYRAISLDESFFAHYTTVEAKEICRYAAAADAAVILNTSLEDANSVSWFQEVGADIALFSLREETQESQILALKNFKMWTDALVGVTIEDISDKKQMKNLCDAGVSLFDIHKAVERDVLRNNYQQYTDHAIAPLLFLDMVKQMGICAGDTYAKACINLNGNRRVF